jgi:hypothetical protein
MGRSEWGTMTHLWSKTPEAVTTDPTLTRSAIRVYQYIDLRAGARGSWWGTQEDIAEALGVTTRTVRRAIVQLAGAEYLRTERTIDHRTALRYYVAARVNSVRSERTSADSDGRSERTPVSGRTSINKDHAIEKRYRSDPFEHVVRRSFDG